MLIAIYNPKVFVKFKLSLLNSAMFCNLKSYNQAKNRGDNLLSESIELFFLPIMFKNKLAILW